ncbi:MAG: AraC family transcriptional regulator [Tannerellaceae bacterium]|jgi:AraC-like DNA-binding protein|nr:AraC family transcriptional regulator [Tannerellaceae bacterium]
MKLLYPHEHVVCKNYVSDFHIGFNYKEVSQGEIWRPEDTYFNHLIFFLDGEAMMSCNEFKNHYCKGGEVVFIVQGADATAEAITGLKYVILSFDNQFTLCDQLALEALLAFERKPAVFNKIDIRPPLQSVIDSVIFYLGHKIQCRHLHAMKQKEMFLVFRAFYTKEEMARFLSPILGGNMDFKAFVLQHYQSVKNVEELANMSKMSVRSFNRKFNQFFGDSPYSWMLKQKSRQIKIKLSSDRVTFGAIIKEYGFSSPAHFTTYCKKQFGQCPSKLRKELIAAAY